MSKSAFALNVTLEKNIRLGHQLHAAIFEGKMPEDESDRKLITRMVDQLKGDGTMIEYKTTVHKVRPVFILTDQGRMWKELTIKAVKEQFRNRKP